MEPAVNKVLIVAYDFPPAATVAIYRPIKFAKYLPKFDWAPFVLTVSNGKFGKYDERLTRIVPKETKVYRAPSFELLNTGESKENAGKKDTRSLWSRGYRRLCTMWSFFTIPDNKVLWVPFATIKGRRIIKREGITDVLVTGKPFSAFITGYLLKRLCRVRLILDYRDPWTQNITYEARSPLHRRIDRWLEQRLVRAADTTIANTCVNEDMLVAEFGRGLERGRFVTIHNGFDSEDFALVVGDKYDKFTITYAGAFYYSIGSSFARGAGNEVMETYSPLFFFRALKSAIDGRPGLVDNIRVNFMGILGHGYDSVIEDMGLSDVINRLGYLDYKDHLEVLKRSHALLLVLSRGEKSRGWIPSKFFSYIGSGNPVLAMVPDGEVRDIIKRSNAGVFVEPDDVEGTASVISEFYDRLYVGGEAFVRNEKAIGEFDRVNLTARLADVLRAPGAGGPVD
jgi:glycosyltransferase involved in cell wall biosynthesis